MRTAIATLSTLLLAVTVAYAAEAPLNPQPLPPGYHARTAITVHTQTEPPDPCVQARGAMTNNHAQMANGEHMQMAHKCSRIYVRPGVHMLNPQPLPPG